MSNVTTLNAKRATSGVELLPGSTAAEVVVDVRYGRTDADLIVRGAPQTDGVIIRDFQERKEAFSKISTVSGKKRILLVYLSGFTMARKADRWVEAQGLVPMDWHTMLSLSETYPMLVRDLKLKQVRLVSLAPVFAYKGESHVCTVHQEDHPNIVRRVMVYEPIKGGWSQEHILGFQL